MEAAAGSLSALGKAVSLEAATEAPFTGVTANGFAFDHSGRGLCATRIGIGIGIGALAAAAAAAAAPCRHARQCARRLWLKRAAYWQLLRRN